MFINEYKYISSIYKMTETTVDKLKEWQKVIDNANNGVIIMKFSAEWCGPCKKVSPLWDAYLNKRPDNVLMIDVDIDDSLDLYMFMKKKRMLNGVPAILVWYPQSNRDEDLWYIPEDSISGFDEGEIISLFARCFSKAIALDQT